ncbi:MAG TPA: glycosyltransferase family 39 protein [Terriglobales bacterium]|nr:glycosyltransferase family 39 protein [Terriglobales bacterium]
MASYFTRGRFGTPQFIAGILLLAFFVQCLWFAGRVPLRDRELNTIDQGLRQWKAGEVPQTEQASPLTGLLAAAPVVRHVLSGDEPPGYWRWLARLPFMFMGVALGASLWYVSRRLFGNRGGYLSLVLFAFSPVDVIRSSTVQPGSGAAWGAFGLIFTSIAVAHTLYAQREVVLWNWRRILLLGVALGVAVASQCSLIVLLPLAAAFMLYLVPERRGAAIAILAAGCAIGVLLLLASYGFHLATLVQAVSSSRALQFQTQMLGIKITYNLLAAFFWEVPAVALLLVIALATFAAWPRPRYFGVIAPLLVFLLLLGMGFLLPHQGGFVFYPIALPFAYVFIAGVFSDLLESRYAGVALGVVLGVCLGHVIFSLSGLLRL